MELKRILARDARAANEKAVAQYGDDVLVISSAQVNGMTELIVAVDIAPLSTEEAEPYLKKEFVQSSGKKSDQKFDVLLGHTLEQNKRNALERKATRPTTAIAEIKPEPAKTVKAAPKAPAAKTEASFEKAPMRTQAELQDSARVREIVDLVREELASLRKEFKLSQQMATWQGSVPVAPALVALRDALNNAQMPVALRALLIDSMKDYDNVPEAMSALQKQLTHTVDQQQTTVPARGVHVIAGPSGSGKSSMVARLAQLAALTHGCEKVAVISFHDHRAGAWNQTQLLNAQSGVDCYRATNVGTLKLLLEEHANRQLILIDTPGVHLDERLSDIRALQRADIEFHALIPADASAATLQRVFGSAENHWNSLMLSKMDETTQPWALLQFLSEKTISVCAASTGAGMSDMMQEHVLSELVRGALDNLSLSTNAAEHLSSVADRSTAVNWSAPRHAEISAHV